MLVRPAVEAGERLGFLPGDLAQKVDPYLRPLYDALYDLMGFDKAAKLFERSTIEIAPLAYMRGRTLNHSFIILDEAQNTTPEQMKMFLTRIGFGTKAVITGDVTQIDLARGQKSGLIEARRVLADVRGIALHRVHQRRRRAPPAGAEDHRRLRQRRTASSDAPPPEVAACADAAGAPRAAAVAWRCNTRSATPTCRAGATLRRWALAALERDAAVTLRFVGDPRRAARSTATTAARTTRPTC